MSLALEGRLEQAEKTVREVLASAEAGGAAYTGLSCMAAGLLADLLFELNDTEAAIPLLEPRIHVLERISLPDTVLHAMTVLSGAHWLAGRRELAWAYLDRLEAYATRFGLDRLLLGALGQRLRRHQQLGEMEAAGAVMQRLEAIAARTPMPARPRDARCRRRWRASASRCAFTCAISAPPRRNSKCCCRMRATRASRRKWRHWRCSRPSPAGS
ncbi:hypothetical protein AU476_31060 [Cupriavidus sp. UYMSc13B]|nr:hypothetical protein AU476_31060 [Cupriavidus sp. UYMSc13B]